eukprot:CAMPEP_0172633936 /NCGR_PEP_ID=MMETSP1068-20121228/191954_1 /TAXON_ID=35684 /ORGANISM="Pseudopedinella elastica, Strain CCMP716" /LENGTH=251 /DNA_ID=CAMNT_0013445757 /DNA_START=15 /DNA_END=767 /DNA_ORIENTATION=+
MAGLCIANLSSNLATQGVMLAEGLLEPVQRLSIASLDPKNMVDAETVRYCLLTIANLAVLPANHPRMLYEPPLDKDTVDNGPKSILAALAGFAGHGDIKCRQNAVLAIGNLCSNPSNHVAIMELGCAATLATYAYPSTDATDNAGINVQFQAVAGLRGLASHPTIRVQLMRDNVMEPLMLAATATSAQAKAFDDKAGDEAGSKEAKEKKAKKEEEVNLDELDDVAATGQTAAGNPGGNPGGALAGQGKGQG